MKILNYLSFTYNFSFYPPSSQRLLHLLKKDIEVPHFSNVGVPGISGNLVVKSKLPPQSGSSLEAVEPHP